MELKQIKELMSVMGRTGTKRLKLKKEDFELILEREESGQIRLADFSSDLNEEQLRENSVTNRANQTLSRGAEMPAGRMVPPEMFKEVPAGQYITSPMVGTFYASASPEDPSFVKVGDKVEKHTVVCIIEAMKVMNEIKAGLNGTIAEILLENGQPVEFGTKLFRII